LYSAINTDNFAFKKWFDDINLPNFHNVYTITRYGDKSKFPDWKGEFGRID